MKKRSVGEALKETRMTLGLTPKEVQRSIRIRVKYIDAIENNDFEVIPGEEHTEAYIKTYAEFLGLDPDVLIEAYHNNTLVEYVDLGEEDVFARREAIRSYGDGLKLQIPVILLSVATLIIFVFLGGIIYMQVSKPAVAPLESSSSSQLTPPHPSSSEKDKSDMVSVVSGSPMRVTVKSKEVISVSFEAKTESPCWVSLSHSSLANGDTLSSTKKTITTELATEVSEAALVVGAPENLTLTIAGKSIDLSHITEKPLQIVITRG